MTPDADHQIISFVALYWVVGAITMNLLLRDLAFLWVTIPGFVLLNFRGVSGDVWEREREQLLFLLTVAMMVTQAVQRLWP